MLKQEMLVGVPVEIDSNMRSNHVIPKALWSVPLNWLALPSKSMDQVAENRSK
jgi:hypothetical protein